MIQDILDISLYVAGVVAIWTPARHWQALFLKFASWAGAIAMLESSDSDIRIVRKAK
ncbi:TPA: hypothetical protein U2T46_002979 [Burkholderia cenocepacia]|nr:hypothetical protein [Burkholderia cenocepacia]